MPDTVESGSNTTHSDADPYAAFDRLKLGFAAVSSFGDGCHANDLGAPVNFGDVRDGAARCRGRLLVVMSKGVWSQGTRSDVLVDRGCMPVGLWLADVATWKEYTGLAAT